MPTPSRTARCDHYAATRAPRGQDMGGHAGHEWARRAMGAHACAGSSGRCGSSGRRGLGREVSTVEGWNDKNCGALPDAPQCEGRPQHRRD